MQACWRITAVGTHRLMCTAAATTLRAMLVGVVAVDAWVKSWLSAAAGSSPSFLQGAITSAANFLQALLGITNTAAAATSSNAVH